MKSMHCCIIALKFSWFSTTPIIHLNASSFSSLSFRSLFIPFISCIRLYSTVSLWVCLYVSTLSFWKVVEMDIRLQFSGKLSSRNKIKLGLRSANLQFRDKPNQNEVWEIFFKGYLRPALSIWFWAPSCSFGSLNSFLQ